MSTIAIRVDEELKDEATKLYKSMGLDMTTAIKLFLTQSVLTQSIPFTIKNYSTSDDREVVSDEELESARLWLKKYVKENANVRRLDVNNKEDMAFLFDEEW
ncbi:type II toxin-antitoxin system RelB/DinJ family antitoxin [Streptococcus acidominimus]|uniref:Type II toxin-antitoxin system RelB/DinJ family antitoxin n=1 Tax=Streptococcus acidominimus TaxID=1326 RepID=A0A4Y9FJT9_STRAI|nr:type II toxin-antitoxin system RelB/DinJ family antitoxin [Streptococcus acidominimus]MBF0819785.1 type II toxin-antitoxin system RelB/DinJ family antitoxin [Streptococcus acidominimus]MBF0838184.1 type II toxin-antitoxin system RelB/DinJ family antitoxin [Streptococcus acidominimus]MBF0846507.1 type II toxin-antitoxin system RelB/DinJ family antitoxin [Streptococcus danieliae]TFU29447.1 type II toxin-antitoxin system RelB/DinJ family antitoxin [Streptococcus acidominimus]